MDISNIFLESDFNTVEKTNLANNLEAPSLSKTKPNRNCLKLTGLDDLLMREYPPVEWIVKDLIPEDAIVLMSAHPASFKTWLALELSLKVATGEDFLGHFSTQKTGVLILDSESGGRQIQKRYKLLGASSNLPIYYDHFISPEMSRHFMSQVIAECKKCDIKLVIFDSFTRFFNGNENDAGEVSKFFENFSFLKQAGVTSLLICHNRKGGADGYNNGHSFVRNESFAVRGSSNITASCDLHLAVSRYSNNSIKITQTKNRFEEELEPFAAQLVKDSDTEVHWEYVEATPEVYNRIKNQVYNYVMANPGKNQHEICNYIMLSTSNAIGEKRIRGILKDLATTKKLYTERGNRTEVLYYACGDEKGER